MIRNPEILRAAYRELVPVGEYPVLENPWDRAVYLSNRQQISIGHRIILLMSDRKTYSGAMVRKACGKSWNQRKNELVRRGIVISDVSTIYQKAMDMHWYKLETPLSRICWDKLQLKEEPVFVDKATNNMKGHIHKITLRILGLSMDEHRDLLERYTGKRSTEELGYDQAKALIKRLHWEFPVVREYLKKGEKHGTH